MEQLRGKRGAMQDKLASLDEKIAQLGLLPQDAFEKFQDRSLKELTQYLNKAQAAIKKYG